MSKSHRGQGVRKLESRGRGTCPVCKRERVKLLYPLKSGSESVDVCKQCRKKKID